MTTTRPIRAEISRESLLHNYRVLQDAAGPLAELLVVVKADAYGHGLAGCAPVLHAAGARWFGVTSMEEAVRLRRLCPQARILALSGLWPGEEDAAIEHRLTPAVWEPYHLDLLEKAASRCGLAAGAFAVHLEIDTGMSRQGVQLRDLAAILERFRAPSPLHLEAVMTHFHSADNPQITAEQERLLALATESIVAGGFRPEMISAGSSASMLQQDTVAVTDLATSIGARRIFRAGIALYGYAPGYAPPQAAVLRPVLSWKTCITALRAIDTGATAGYDATFRAARPTRLALLPVGYADGLSRLLSNRGFMLVRGQHAPIAGRVSMDQTLLDVTDIPEAAVGDEVVLIGRQGNETITAADLAHLTGTIPYEILCDVAARVPRIMVDEPC